MVTGKQIALEKTSGQEQCQLKRYVSSAFSNELLGILTHQAMESIAEGEFPDIHKSLHLFSIETESYYLVETESQSLFFLSWIHLLLHFSQLI